MPVKKKNGQIRLCVDLRPPNSRVAKQKFSFPIIEECLSRLGGKSVFMLLDLKVAFIRSACTKIRGNTSRYFAIPDGQFEYTRLPFGFCESPAEFQKRLIQILNPLIREDKVLIYMDDVLIPTETVEQNLVILKKILFILKKYNFKLNYRKY